MKKEKIYKLIDKYLESEFISENDEIILSLPHINSFINNIDRELKLEYQDNISEEDFLKPLLSELVEKLPELQLSLNYYDNDNEYTVFLRPEHIFNNIEFIKIFDDIICKFDEKYDSVIYFNAIDEDYFFDDIVLTGKEYKK